MSKITQVGSYRGVVLEHAVSMTKESSLPQFVAKLRALECYDAAEKTWIDFQHRGDCEITAYLVLFDKGREPIFHANDVQKVFEWDGVSLMGLNLLDLEGAEVQFEVIEHTFKDKISMQVANIRGYNDEPGGSIKKLDATELSQLNAKFGNALKKLSGGPKVASAKAPTTPPTAPPTKAKRGRPKKKAAVPPPPTAPTEAAAEAAATAPVKELPVEEAVEEFETVPATRPAPPAAPPAAPVKETGVMTYETAWAECYNRKAKTVTDETLASNFQAAMYRIAPGQTEDEISSEDWTKISDVVIAECGVF